MTLDRTRAIPVWGVLLLGLFASRASGADRVATVGRMDKAEGFVAAKGEARIVPDGPRGANVVRFDDPFDLRFDLAGRAIDAHDYDLLKIEVKADAHAFLVVSLENFPKPGELSHWYVLDTARGEFPWRTIWIDLKKPEEVKRAGTYKGMAQNDPRARGLHLRGNVATLRRSIQGPGRGVWLGPVRFMRKTIDLDWNQAEAPMTWGAGDDLTFQYPLKLTNPADRPITARLQLTPIGAVQAAATLAQQEVTLEARESKTVEARISLPQAVAAKAPLLYCERFQAIASVAGEPDSDVTILRSSDPIPLSVTVPIPEDKLQFPLLPRVSGIPESVTLFNEKNRARAVTIAGEAAANDLDLSLGKTLEISNPGYGFWFDGKPNERQQADSRFREGLTACAFLYDFTGEQRYLDKGTKLLLRAAERFPERANAWRQIPWSPISHGIFSANTLRTGWATGSMRWPYAYERHGMFNDFDLLARDMEPAAREKIIRDFLVPAAIQMRNHYFGLTNQQDVVNYPVLYAGLASRNWPLVSHAYDSEHGLLNQIQFNFDDEGLAGEGNYHKPTIEPILYACELLRARGIDLYDQRLYMILHSPAAAAIKKEYNSPMLDFADAQRFSHVRDIATARKSDGAHVTTGSTVLRWKGKEVAMNWGVQQNRGAPDRCSLRMNDLGGGNYTHSSLGQSIIIVDEGRQDPVPATVLGYDVIGPVQYVCATSDRHYPGSRITRTFALFDEGVLVLDRVTSDRPRTVDWCLKGAGEKVAPKLAEVAGGFTQKPDDTAANVLFGANLQFNRHFTASTDRAWSEGNGRLTMAGENGTEIYAFRVPAAFSAGKAQTRQGVAVLMARRRDVAQTDFVAFYSGKTKTVERVAVQTDDETTADALGAKITLKNGKVIHALVNFETGKDVHLGSLKTKQRFATDLPDE
jgi:hypothetical protein